MSRSRSYFLTINNPESNELPQDSLEKYAVWQREKGENGTEHLQAVVHFSNAVSFSKVKKLYPTAHIEVCKDLNSSIEYCQKDDTRIDGPWERGDTLNPKP